MENKTDNFKKVEQVVLKEMRKIGMVNGMPIYRRDFPERLKMNSLAEAGTTPYFWRDLVDYIYKITDCPIKNCPLFIKSEFWSNTIEKFCRDWYKKLTEQWEEQDKRNKEKKNG